jgi:hypothetical protein
VLGETLLCCGCPPVSLVWLCHGLRPRRAPRGRKIDPVDAHSVAMVALRAPNLVRVEVDDDLVVMGMLVDRRDELGRARTQTINRLHRLLLDIFPGGAPQFLSSHKARALIATIRPRELVGKTRRRLAVELIVELEGIDKKIQGHQKGTRRARRGPRLHPDDADRDRSLRRGSAARRRGRHPPVRRPRHFRLLERHRPRWMPPPASSSVIDSPAPATGASTEHCTSWP